MKKLGKFSSGGVTFERKGLPVKAGDRIEVTVICPSGGTATFKRADLAKAYLVAAGIADFPVDKVSLATDPPSCAPEPPAGPASAATAAAGASAATSQGTSGPKISADAVLTALKKVPNFASAGVSLAPKGAPVKAGDRIEASIVCPSGNTTVLKKTDIARSYLSTAGVTDFPVERMSITTEPPSCAPS